MNRLKRIALICLATFITVPAIAQDSTALINFQWQVITRDTSLTYLQMVTLCDMQQKAIDTVLKQAELLADHWTADL